MVVILPLDFLLFKLEAVVGSLPPTTTTSHPCVDAAEEHTGETARHSSDNLIAPSCSLDNSPINC